MNDSEKTKRTRKHAQEHQAKLIRMIENTAAELLTLDIVPSYNIGLTQAVEVMSYTAAKYADNIRLTQEETRFLIGLRRAEEERNLHRERVKNDPSMN